jgi:hypothetical protein
MHGCFKRHSGLVRQMYMEAVPPTVGASCWSAIAFPALVLAFHILLLLYPIQPAPPALYTTTWLHRSLALALHSASKVPSLSVCLVTLPIFQRLRICLMIAPMSTSSFIVRWRWRSRHTNSLSLCLSVSLSLSLSLCLSLSLSLSLTHTHTHTHTHTIHCVPGTGLVA